MRDPITNPSAGDVLLIGQIPGEHGPEGGFERHVIGVEVKKGVITVARTVDGCDFTATLDQWQRINRSAVIVGRGE